MSYHPFRVISAPLALSIALRTQCPHPLIIPASLLDGHHDFADLLVRLQLTMCINYLLKRKRLRDQWLELTHRQTFDDELLGSFEPQRIASDLKEEVSPNGQRFAKHGEKRYTSGSEGLGIQ
jgi:hypothetical protein